MKRKGKKKKRELSVVWVVCFKCEKVFLAVAVRSFEVIAILCFSSEADVEMSHWLLFLCSELAPLHVQLYGCERDCVLAQLLQYNRICSTEEKHSHIFSW